MNGLLYLDLHSRKVCMGFSTSHCCDNPVTEVERFSVFIIKDGDPNETCLIEYPMFDVNDQEQMCVVLDDAMTDLCNGRYIFQVVFDKCISVAEVPFMWGGEPVLTSVDVESRSGSTVEGCFGEFEAGLEIGPKIPDVCCEPDCDSACGADCEVCIPLAEHVPDGTLSPYIKPKDCCE